MPYSSADDIAKLTHTLIFGAENDIKNNGVTPSRRPMLVLDMDGNIAIGHNVKQGISLTLSPSDNPDNQSIPSSASLADLIAEGKVKESLFSLKPMDTRIPQKLVSHINRLQDQNQPFDVVLLTSRSTKDALKILSLSGVNHPKQVTVVGDSGAVMRFKGAQKDIRPLSTPEKAFLSAVADKSWLANVEHTIDAVLTEEGYSTKNRPPLFVEPKGIATNIHYAEILKHLKQKEGSKIDARLGDTIKSALNAYVTQASPLTALGEPVFKVLDGPCTLELKVAEVDKGKGLEAVVKTALAEGYQPSSVVFAGDDICKRDEQGHVSHGTDYPGFVAAPLLQEKTGIPFYTLHTQHPQDGKLHNAHPLPAENKDARAASITPTLVLATPLQTADWVSEVVEKTQERTENIQKTVQKRLSAIPPSAAVYR